jgi:hypothetical protein
MGKSAPLLLKNRIAATKAERALESGEWLQLKITPTLEDWDVFSGQWEGTADGALTHAGTGKPAMILHSARVGSSFELRGEYEVESPPDRDEGLGVMLGYTGSTTRDWLLCTQFRSGADHAGALLRQFYPTAAPTVNLGKLPPKRTFFISSKDGHVTYMINDKAVVTDHVPRKSAEDPAPLAILPEGRIGFTNYKFPENTITRVLKVEVRRLK